MPFPKTYTRNGGSQAYAPGVATVKLTKGASELTNGPCRALWIGTAGTLNGVDMFGNTITDFPAKAGLLPIGFSKVTSGGTADDIWAIY